MKRGIMQATGEKFGADGVEIDAHMLCAEDHLPYQGRQYSDREFELLQDSLPRPFGEWNCRHSRHPIIPGVSPRLYSDEELREMQDYSREEIEIDGKTKTRYEWSQEQRRIETAIRQQKDTAILAKASGDKELADRCKGNVLKLNRYYDQVSAGSGLRTRYDKTRVPDGRNAKSDDISLLSPNFKPTTRRIDYSASYDFTQGNVRLMNMLRSNEPADGAKAVDEVLTDRYQLPESKWKHVVNVKGLRELNWAGGRKEPDCSISVCESLKFDVGLHIHENLHSRSASKHLDEDIPYRKALEEGAVEYLTKIICEENHIPHNLQYKNFVGAYINIKYVISKDTSELEFAKKIIDIPLNQRYNKRYD